ncbi:acyl-CoA desaturase [Stieleria varia]|uniref:Fatty acid desaturase n=1 Tax=Stieleria varia TaxID=2528005 RepID=A0A5C5ZYG0_9BACT|nr:fatty acid desaturase [Stieleria varia]TWT91991.1 Fatty acid desaturase [Stieleria varia]
MSTVNADGHGFEKTLPARRFVRYQRQHVLLVNVLPLIGTLIAFALLPWYPPTPATLIALVVLWPLTLGVGGSVGFHRCFTHRSFECARPVKLILAIFGTIGGQGPVASWVATHRRHHDCSDDVGDPHSPVTEAQGGLAKLRAFWHSHCGWMVEHDMPNPLFYTPDILKDSDLMWFSRHYYRVMLVGLFVPVALLVAFDPSWQTVWLGLLWTGAVRLTLTSQFIWAINSVCHFVGYRRYHTSDESRNVALICVPTCGESWHNNHHAFPTSARFGLRWWQFDFGWLVIRLLQFCGLAWNVKVPAADKIVGGPDAS